MTSKFGKRQNTINFDAFESQRCATTLNPKTARRQPVVQAQILVVQGSALWEFFRKSAVLQGKRPWRTGEKVARIQILLFSP